MCVYMNICTSYIKMHINVSVQAYVAAYTLMQICVYMGMYKCVHRHTHIYLYCSGWVTSQHMISGKASWVRGDAGKDSMSCFSLSNNGLC